MASQVVTLFLLMGVGFVLAKLAKLQTDGVAQMAYITLYIVTPCVIIDSFQVEKTGGLVHKLVLFFVFYLLSTLVNILIANFCFRGERPDRGCPMRFGMVYGNNGFMGLPLLQSIFGSQAIIYGVVSMVVFNGSLWTHGVKVMGGKITLRQVLVNPATVGVAVGVTLFATGWRFPNMIGAAVHHVANLNTPLAMIVIGAQMAGANLKSCLTNKKLYVATAFRLILSPLIPLVLLIPFRLDPMLYCSLIVMCAVPVAGATGMLAQRFGRDTALAAEMVSFSTLLSVITLPLMTVAAQAISGL
ncbi:MAG: AEC family transporter [Clostridia bacterium]|nr:AEC family transporter [Clostridia bacterium]